MLNQSLRDILAARAAAAGEDVKQFFTVSRGPWTGFNGSYEYAVTGQSVWEARWTAGSLVGGAPRIESYPRSEVHLTLTPGSKDGDLTLAGDTHHVSFLDAEVAQLAAKSLGQSN